MSTGKKALEDASKIRTQAALRVIGEPVQRRHGAVALKREGKTIENLRRMAWNADRAIALVMQAP